MPLKQRNLVKLYMYKKDLALNNLQWWICHKTKPISQTIQVRQDREQLEK